MEPHTDEGLRLAKIHFIAEREAHRSSVSGEQDLGPLIDLEARWRTAIWIHLNEYIEKARQLDIILAASGKTVPRDGYEEFVKELYKAMWAGMDKLASVLVQIPLDMFNEMAKRYVDSSDLPGHHGLPLRDNHTDNDAVSVHMQDRSYIDLDDFEDDSDDVGDLAMDDINSPAGLPRVTNLRENEKPIIRKLETATKNGVQVLEQLRQIFEESRIWTGDTNWVNEITETVEYAEPAKVIVGVIGTTGAGKSSVLNAIADEENILATNCMRASTAVATEVSYNYGDSQYMAQIEFISREEWEREANLLFEHVQESDTPGEVQNDPDTALALDKILAVYPSLNKKDIFSSSIEDLTGHTSVSNLLGTTDVIEENDARIFSEKLISYLDSRGNTKGNKGVLSKPDPLGKEIRLWPLIRVVRIYVKAEALSTGAVLVDLPGLNDTNSARSQVAEDYMKRCSAHWIVTPINRAVDDKLAHELLNKNLKTQMQMDCTFNNITVICTKTDDISTAEVERSLRLDIPENDLRDKLKGEVKEKEKESRKLNAEEEKVDRKLNRVEDRVDTLEASRGSFGDSPMRISTTPHVTPRKTKQEDYPEKEMGIESSPLSPENDEGLPGSQVRTPKKSPEKQLSYLISMRNELRPRLSSIRNQIKTLESDIRRGKAEIVDCQTAMTYRCIEGRNDFAKQVMKSYFAQVKRELDQEGMEHAGEQGQTGEREPETELPIFNVSSKAYQKLRGRFRTDNAIDGFKTLEHTGVPQLQRHCIHLTEQAREASARRFLHQFDQLLRSIGIWSGAANQFKTLEDQAKEELEKKFEIEVNKLYGTATSMLNGLCSQIDAIYNRNIFSRLDQAATQGVAESAHTVARWNETPSGGGIRWNTYRATCRFEGEFKNINWNKDLAEPMRTNLSSNWARTFNTEVPSTLETFAKSIRKCLAAFHISVINLAKQSLSLQNKKTLQDILTAHNNTFAHHVRSIAGHLQNYQKISSRRFTEVISQELQQTYRECSGYKGLGSLRRMRDTMTRRVHNGSDMFSKSGAAVRDHLDEKRISSKERLQGIIRSLVHKVSRDYKAALIQAQAKQFTDDQLKIKERITKIIEETQTELQLADLLKEDAEGVMTDAEGESELGKPAMEDGDQMDTTEE